jgi:NAD(P)-dependent dehydrogenase (short-subunit alcohol dehydrogenase family)
MNLAGGKVVAVGGASGMALATVRLLHEFGMRVAILDRAGSKGPEVARELGIPFHACDITDFPQTEAALRAAAADLGGLNVVITTAGGGIVMRTLSKNGPHPMEDFARVVDLNLNATFNIARVAADLISKETPDASGERGVIINTSSIAAFEGQIGQVAYSASKAGIAGMTLTMARDLGNLGIRVMAVAPSLFDTGATQGVPVEMVAALTKDAAFPKRMGAPQEFALLAKSIIENGMLNGDTIRLDAGVRFAPR